MLLAFKKASGHTKHMNAVFSMPLQMCQHVNVQAWAYMNKAARQTVNALFRIIAQMTARFHLCWAVLVTSRQLK